MASIIGVSSLYQTPSVELSRRATSTSASIAPSDGLPHFATVLKAGPCKFPEACHCSLRGSRPATPLSVASAIATPNSVLSEEAFKGLGGRFGKSPVDEEEGSGHEEEEYGSEEEAGEGGEGDDVLAIANLGLPEPLVESLHKRGITHLFPIQVDKMPSTSIR